MSKNGLKLWESVKSGRHIEEQNREAALPKNAGPGVVTRVRKSHYLQDFCPRQGYGILAFKNLRPIVVLSWRYRRLASVPFPSRLAGKYHNYFPFRGGSTCCFPGCTDLSIARPRHRVAIRAASGFVPPSD